MCVRERQSKRKRSSEPQSRKVEPTSVLAMTGPGAGKGTQCAKIVEDFGCAPRSFKIVEWGSHSSYCTVSVDTDVTVALCNLCPKRTTTTRAPYHFMLPSTPRHAPATSALGSADATHGERCESDAVGAPIFLAMTWSHPSELLRAVRAPIGGRSAARRAGVRLRARADNLGIHQGWQDRASR
eukprot:6172457-Pleurochrysis_carterae.AAC.1